MFSRIKSIFNLRKKIQTHSNLIDHVENRLYKETLIELSQRAMYEHYLKVFIVHDAAFMENNKTFLIGKSPIIDETKSLLADQWKTKQTTIAFQEMVDKINQLDERTLRQSSSFEKLEARVEDIAEEKITTICGTTPSTLFNEEFAKVIKNLNEFENAENDSSKKLYYIMELEMVLGELEQKALATGHKYEGRLSASLRDICRLYEPSNISEEQIEIFISSTRTLIKGWGNLNREKVSWIRTKLLEVGLSWLPVTDIAVKATNKTENIRE